MRAAACEMSHTMNQSQTHHETQPSVDAANPAATPISGVNTYDLSGPSALPQTPLTPAPFPQRIVLTGFMGSGKSTIGRLLARHLRWRFVDADHAIESAAGKSITAIFADHGEPWFRELEHQTIRNLVNSKFLVLALGGGAVEDPRTRELLKSEGVWLIHLEICFETVLIRCRGSEAIRPVLADRANLQSRYERRLPLYRESHLNLAVDQLRPPAILDIILKQIGTVPQS